MNEPGAARGPLATGALARAGYVALLAAVVLATVAAVLAGGGPLFAMLPVLMVAGGYAIMNAPLRSSTAVLTFLLLAADDHGESIGQWRTPFAWVGDLLHYRLDDAAGVPGLAVTGMEVGVVVLLAAWAFRGAKGASVDTAGQVAPARVMRGLVLVYVVAVAYAVANGVVHGQSLAPWKIRNLLHPILLFVLFSAALRGPQDHLLFGRLVVGAAVVRAILSIVVQRIAIAETGGKYATATSHGDSVLFSVAVLLLLADAMERPDWRRAGRAALLVPLLLAGMAENGRRIAWVMLGLMLVVTYLISPMRGWKRSLTRFVVVSLPVIALYVAVGWNREGRIFAPLQTLRGVSDTSYDHSAYWREVENWNIAMSMRERPVLGLGLGGRYSEHMFNDDISSLYREYREWPHNTVLGLLLLMGLLAFTVVWSLSAAALFLAFRSYRVAVAPEHRAAALACVAMLVACHVLGYGDTGAHYPQYKIFLGLALAVASKLAVVTGAWPSRHAAAPELSGGTAIEVARR
jgi:hypothetical protein